MSLAAAEKGISEVTPHFLQDLDEDWMRDLSEIKCVYMRKKRTKYFNAREDLDKLRSSYEKDRHAGNWDDATKKSRYAIYKKAKAEYEKKLATFLTDCTSKFRGLKLEAEKARAALYKRPRIETNPNQVVIDVERDPRFDDDNYLPRMNFDEPDIKKSPTSSNKSKQSNETQSPQKPVEPLRVDPLIIGTKPRDAEILLKLKPLVNKYNCREKVLRFMRICRKQNANKKAMESFYKYFDIIDPKRDGTRQKK